MRVDLLCGTWFVGTKSPRRMDEHRGITIGSKTTGNCTQLFDRDAYLGERIDGLAQCSRLLVRQTCWLSHFAPVSDDRLTAYFRVVEFAECCNGNQERILATETNFERFR